MTDESYQKVISEIESMTAEDIEKLSKKLTEEMKLYIPSPWHTGTPAEEGWYLLCYPRRNEVAEHYEVAEFDGRDFVFATGMHQVVVRTSPLSVAWMPITPYEEKENGR